MIPVLGRVYLSVDEYVTWALLLTVLTATFIFDLGGSAYVQSFGYGRRVPRVVLRRALAMSVVGSLAVGATATAAAAVLASRLSVTQTPRALVVVVAFVGLAATVRAGWTISLVRMQVEENFVARAACSALNVITLVGSCWLLLSRGAGVMALPVSVALSSVIAMAGAVLVPRRPESGEVSARPMMPARQFAVWRTATALVAIVSSQADRWVLATMDVPQFLANYDVALRIALLPTAVAVTVFAGLVAEAASVRPTSRRPLVIRATRQIAALVALLSCGLAAAYWIAIQLGWLAPSWTLVLLFAMASVWLGVNALTAPTTMTLVATGRPGRELAYAVPSLVMATMGWALAVANGQPWLVPLSMLFAVVVWSLWFVIHYASGDRLRGLPASDVVALSGKPDQRHL